MPHRMPANLILCENPQCDFVLGRQQHGAEGEGALEPAQAAQTDVAQATMTGQGPAVPSSAHSQYLGAW